MSFKAIHRFARIAPTKVRPLATLIRGKTVADGLDALKYLPHRGARMLEKVLESARANAEDRGARNIEDLVVSESRVDGGPIMKRIRPRARGTAYPIKRRYSHIIVTLSEPDEE